MTGSVNSSPFSITSITTVNERQTNGNTISSRKFSTHFIIHSFYNNLKSTLVTNQPRAPAHRTEGMSERYILGGGGGAKRWQKVSRNRAIFWLALIVSANWLQANWLISETESRRKLISDNRRTTISSPALFRYTTEWMERDCLLLASGRRATAAVCLPKLSSPCFRVCVS